MIISPPSIVRAFGSAIFLPVLRRQKEGNFKTMCSEGIPRFLHKTIGISEECVKGLFEAGNLTWGFSNDKGKKDARQKL